AGGLMRYTLAQAGSQGTMTEGTFYYASGTLYVWLVGGGDPTGRTYLFASTPIHWGVGLRRVNGADERLLCHNYSWQGGDYRATPFSTTSPDGRLVMFSSNMGVLGGRVDVLVAEVPPSSGGGGGGPCCQS